MGNEVPDSLLKIVDVRAGMRPLGVSQFPPGASFVAFDPKWSCAVQVCGSNGSVQRVDVGAYVLIFVFFTRKWTDDGGFCLPNNSQVRRSPTRFRRFTCR